MKPEALAKLADALAGIVRPLALRVKALEDGQRQTDTRLLADVASMRERIAVLEIRAAVLETRTPQDTTP